MRASLLDRADLTAVRAAAARGTGPWAVATACLLAPGVVQHDPGDPSWPDRDRLVVGDPAAGAALDAGLVGLGHAPGSAWLDAGGGHALGLARGLAAASDLDGGIFRVWCLLGSAAAAEGSTWEAALDAPGGSLAVVAVLPAGEERRTVALLETAGWRVARASATEPAEFLGALDRALLPAAPGAVVATWASS